MNEPTLYEAIYILDTSLPEDEAAELIATMEEAVREVGGEVVGTRDFRTRRLAYEINGHTHGAYKLLYFHGDGAVVEHLRGEMAVRQPIIRSRVFVANPDALIGADAEEEAAEEAAPAAEEAAAVAEAPVDAEALTDAEAPAVAEVPAAESPAESAPEAEEGAPAAEAEGATAAAEAPEEQ